MSIPVEAKSFTYTPECFAGMKDAPAFTMRYGTRRDRHAYQDAIRQKRLRSHDKEDFRAVILDEIRTKWANDALPIDEVIASVERYFSAADELDGAIKAWAEQCKPLIEAHQEAQKADPDVRLDLPTAPELDFPPLERERVENLLADVEEHSERLGRMNKDNGRREREIRRIALALLLEDTSLGLPMKRDMDGLLPEDTIYAIEDALDEFSDAEDHRGGVAFSQLGNKALMSFFLTREEEKNSASPSPTTTDQSGSTAQEPTASTTKTSASKAPASDPTPATSSTSATPT